MIGSRIGSKARFVGSVVGSSGDDEGNDPFAGIARDATSNIYYPADAAQWTQFRSAGGLAIANPDHLFLCQDAAGNLANAMGGAVLTATGIPVYQQAVSGHTRLGVRVSADGAADRFAWGGGVGPNPTTTSIRMLAVGAVPASPAAVRTMMGVANFANAVSNNRMIHLTTGLPRHQEAGANVDGVVSISSTVQPLALLHDVTNSVVKAYTKDEKITSVFGAVIDGAKGVGQGTMTVFTYVAVWAGAAAEISDADFKACLTAMGFTIAWS